MREIKFRAWDKEKRYMHLEVQDVYDDSGTKTRPYLGDSFGGVLESENMVVMQFTGLKDKNGKEIYEGDIVKFEFTDSNNDTLVSKGIIEWIDNGWGIKEVENSFAIEGEIEVIGNKFENPELLK